jgi:hypothetical protein
MPSGHWSNSCFVDFSQRLLLWFFWLVVLGDEMEYITSRGFKLPESDAELRDGVWFNMWRTRLWPYKELVTADLLFWYESPSKAIVWKTRVVDTDRFVYEDKAAAADRMEERFGRVDRGQWYYIKAPGRGCCLAYKVTPLQRINLEKPAGLDFPRQGWLRVDNGIAQRWLSQKNASDDSTLDEIVPGGALLERLEKLNQAMADVSPLRIRTLVAQTIRRDSGLVKTLKKLCSYRCQFPECGIRIPKRDGSFYVEVAHIEAVRHGGRSVLGNLLVLCPNHHKEVDYGALLIFEQTVDYLRGSLNGREFNIRLPVIPHQRGGSQGREGGG